MALLSSCGNGDGSSTSPSSSPTTGIQKDALGCVVGTWKAGSSTQGAPQFESNHFAFSWTGSIVDQSEAKEVADAMERAFAYYTDVIGLPPPNCGNPEKTKINVSIADTFYGVEYARLENGVGAIHLELQSLDNHRAEAHELVHVFQDASRNGSSLPGSIREAHAEFMSAQIPEYRDYVGCVAQEVSNPHLYFGLAQNRYCSWTFLEYLKEKVGYSPINDIFTGGSAGLSGLDAFDLLMRTQKWSMGQLNDLFATWATHNIAWDYKDADGYDRGANFQNQIGPYQTIVQSSSTALQLTRMEPIDLPYRRFAVAADAAPQRWGYNLVRLYPDDGATTVSVDFRGLTQAAPATTTLANYANRPIVMPTPSSGWRWAMVVIDASGSPRYSKIMQGGDERLTIDVKPDDQSVYLMIMGAPTQFTAIGDTQPYFSIYRYPWMVQLTNALPYEYLPGASDPDGTHRQANGGGLVSDYATVDPSAYVGPYAQVLGGTVGPNARIEDHAIVFNGNISGSARVGALSMIEGFDVTDSARIAAVFAPMGYSYFKLSGTAQLLGDIKTDGDVSQIGGSAFKGFSKGVYYGIINQSDELNPAKGALQNDPAAEVTAVPNYKWR